MVFQQNLASFAANRFMIVFKPASVLAVAATTLHAYQKNKGVQLEWFVNNPADIESFEIEKSLDTRQFIKIGGIKNTATSTAKFNWFDADCTSGNNYYRVKIISKAGSVTYTKVAVVLLKQSAGTLTLLANPVKNLMVLRLNQLEGGRYQVELFNNLAQKVADQTLQHNGLTAAYSINLPQLAQGVYTLNVYKGEKITTLQVIVE